MKTAKTSVTLAGCLSLLTLASPVQANLIAYTGPALDIPDNHLTGLTSTLFVSGSINHLNGLEVTLDISGVNGQGFNGDLYIYLLHGTDMAVLLNRAGRTADNPDGYADARGFKLTITDSATRDLHNYQNYPGGLTISPLTGVWGADARNSNPFDVTEQDPRNAPLGTFLNADPNGYWSLFIADLSPSGISQLNGWSLRFLTVPENDPWCVHLIAAVGLYVFNFRVGSKHRPAIGK